MSDFKKGEQCLTWKTELFPQSSPDFIYGGGEWRLHLKHERCFYSLELENVNKPRRFRPFEVICFARSGCSRDGWGIKLTSCDSVASHKIWDALESYVSAIKSDSLLKKPNEPFKLELVVIFHELDGITFTSKSTDDKCTDTMDLTGYSSDFHNIVSGESPDDVQLKCSDATREVHPTVLSERHEVSQAVPGNEMAKKTSGLKVIDGLDIPGMSSDFNILLMSRKVSDLELKCEEISRSLHRKVLTINRLASRTTLQNKMEGSTSGVKVIDELVKDSLPSGVKNLDEASLSSDVDDLRTNEVCIAKILIKVAENDAGSVQDFDDTDKASLSSGCEELDKASLCSDSEELDEASLCSIFGDSNEASLFSDFEALEKSSLSSDSEDLYKASVCVGYDNLTSSKSCDLQPKLQPSDCDNLDEASLSSDVDDSPTNEVCIAKLLIKVTENASSVQDFDDMDKASLSLDCEELDKTSLCSDCEELVKSSLSSDSEDLYKAGVSLGIDNLTSSKSCDLQPKCESVTEKDHRSVSAERAEVYRHMLGTKMAHRHSTSSVPKMDAIDKASPSSNFVNLWTNGDRYDFLSGVAGKGQSQQDEDLQGLFPHKMTKSDSTSGFEEIDDLEKDLSSDLLTSDGSSDIQLKRKDPRFHQLYLATWCNIFSTLLGHKMAESTGGVHDVDDFDKALLSSLLMFVFSGNLSDLPDDEMNELYAVADKYTVHFLRKTCSDWMIENLSAKNYQPFLAMADIRHDPKFKNCLIASITNHPQWLDCRTWLQFSKEHPTLANEVYHDLYDKTFIRSDPLD